MGPLGRPNSPDHRSIRLQGMVWYLSETTKDPKTRAATSRSAGLGYRAATGEPAATVSASRTISVTAEASSSP